MKRPLALLALSLAAAWPAAAQDQPGQQASPGGHPAECFCRAEGRIFAVGETACLRSAEGRRMAQCSMVLNNTSWQFTTQTCPES